MNQKPIVFPLSKLNSSGKLMLSELRNFRHYCPPKSQFPGFIFRNLHEAITHTDTFQFGIPLENCLPATYASQLLYALPSRSLSKLHPRARLLHSKYCTACCRKRISPASCFSPRCSFLSRPGEKVYVRHS